MKKRNNKRTKKIRNLVVICTLSAIVLAVSTYAWFIGMKTVNVSSFDISIATTEGLFLSMDGENWSYNLDARNVASYTDSTNSWAPEGLIPVSTVGDMDKAVSRMMLYEKGSLTTTPGGFRLLTSRVHNYDKDNTGKLNVGKGYVVFDLFIKNLSGTEYYTKNEVGNEEAIYLTTNSSVVVAPAGANGEGGIANTGIENSVRVAFAQIGRVKADTETVGNITGITCSDVAASEGQVQVTGICRDAQIWEPNDTKHVANAISWYDTSCRKRLATGSDLTLNASYDKLTHCGTVADTSAATTKVTYPTYAISRSLIVEDNVDVYDGLEYNLYEANTKDYATYKAGIKPVVGDTEESLTAKHNTYKLVKFPYFTDTMKNYTGTARPTFMTLAPNSITKVRIYVYIEGQDVDNYDFASLGKKISVKFGFTKERYIENDIGYQGPSTIITPTIENATVDTNS